MTDQTPDFCPTCGIDLDYPTGPHILDCPAPTAAPPLNGMTDQTPSSEDVLDAVVEYGKHCEDAVESFRCATPDLEDVRTALAARDREVAAKAWDEGLAAHASDALNAARGYTTSTRNPYRIGAGDE